METVAVYGWLTNTRHKLLVVVENAAAQAYRDADIRAVFNYLQSAH